MKSFWRLFFALAGFGAATILFSFYIFFQSGTRQALIPPAFVLIGVLTAGPIVIYLPSARADNFSGNCHDWRSRRGLFGK